MRSRWKEEKKCVMRQEKMKKVPFEMLRARRWREEEDFNNDGGFVCSSAISVITFGNL